MDKSCFANASELYDLERTTGVSMDARLEKSHPTVKHVYQTKVGFREDDCARRVNRSHVSPWVQCSVRIPKAVGDIDSGCWVRQGRSGRGSEE